MACHGFYHWIRLYYQASEKYINDRRQKEATVWEYLVELYPKLSSLEKKGVRHIERLSDADLERQLKDEIEEN
jgi:hypothetical protein